MNGDLRCTFVLKQVQNRSVKVKQINKNGGRTDKKESCLVLPGESPE
jgi:hypothetical protein